MGVAKLPVAGTAVLRRAEIIFWRLPDILTLRKRINDVPLYRTLQVSALELCNRRSSGSPREASLCLTGCRVLRPVRLESDLRYARQQFRPHSMFTC